MWCARHFKCLILEERDLQNLEQSNSILNIIMCSINGTPQRLLCDSETCKMIKTCLGQGGSKNDKGTAKNELFISDENYRNMRQDNSFFFVFKETQRFQNKSFSPFRRPSQCSLSVNIYIAVHTVAHSADARRFSQNQQDVSFSLKCGILSLCDF